MIVFPIRLVRNRALLLLLAVLGLVACEPDSDRGHLQLNETDGVQFLAPGFLVSRAIDQANLLANVVVTANGQSVPANGRLERADGRISWVGEVIVPPDSDVILTVEWLETGRGGLPDSLERQLILASKSLTINGVNNDQAITFNSDEYDVGPPDGSAALDLDEDGFGNLREIIEGSDPNDAASTPESSPPDVVILYSPTAPVIDGGYDSLWENAQFKDRVLDNLTIDNVLINRTGLQIQDDRSYRWAGMHDGRYLYLMVFSEAFGQQTPFGDSALAYNDDAVDVFWDGNNSKGTTYDGVDDHHAIIALLAADGSANSNTSGQADARFELGDRSSPLSETAFSFATCLCASNGEQQLYEIRLDLQAARIPLDKQFGFDIQLNNDLDGDDRDEKWAWHNDTGTDDTWRFPIRMGTARLEPIPQ